jgi:uncharacterized protein YlxW (UPF0749 family)
MPMEIGALVDWCSLALIVVLSLVKIGQWKGKVERRRHPAGTQDDIDAVRAAVEALRVHVRDNLRDKIDRDEFESLERRLRRIEDDLDASRRIVSDLRTETARAVADVMKLTQRGRN